MRADHDHAVVATTRRLGDDVAGRHVIMHYRVNEQMDHDIVPRQFLADSPARADHRDGHDRAAEGAKEGILSRLVIVDDRTQCASSFGVHRLVAEVAYTAFDQGNLVLEDSGVEIGGTATIIGSQRHGRCHVAAARVLHGRKPGDIVGRVDRGVRRNLLQHRV